MTAFALKVDILRLYWLTIKGRHIRITCNQCVIQWSYDKYNNTLMLVIRLISSSLTICIYIKVNLYVYVYFIGFFQITFKGPKYSLSSKYYTLVVVFITSNMSYIFAQSVNWWVENNRTVTFQVIKVTTKDVCSWQLSHLLKDVRAPDEG